MALWGNNDNLNSSGTVSVNYANRTVTGTGTTFGAAGAGHTEAQVGDVIRFGQAFGCLLYTSPSPRDRTRSRMPSSA